MPADAAGCCGKNAERGDRRPPRAGLPKEATRIAVVVNPQTLHGTTQAAWQHAIERLRRDANVSVEVQTRGETADLQHLIDLIHAHQPDVVVAAGGDGTVSDVVRALVATPSPPALGIFPLGTANNVARSLGLASIRRAGTAGADRAAAAIVGRNEKRIDLGEADGRPFIGSFALGMDADILGTRNRLQRSWGLPRRIGGYPLYFWSFGVNVFRRHGGEARLTVDGCQRRQHFYNILVTNTPIHAGEFRFVGKDFPDDGRLDLHPFGGAADYLRQYPAAWRRHVHHEAGRVVLDPERARVRNLTIETEDPVSAQMDGEEIPPATRFVIRVLPGALVVKVPPSTDR